MTLVQRFPAGAPVAPDALVTQVRGAESPRVGDERIVAFLGAFARRLLAPTSARRHPELASLGFFLRSSELARITAPGPRLRVPRGLVFHVPPANVDTVFAYSWALSALAGNRNIVRISPRGGAVADALLAVLGDTLSDVDAETAALVAATQRMVTYDRSDAAGTAFSAACDLRVIWGGDASIAALRQYPLAPHARDLTFPDRSSFAIVSVRAWQTATPEARVRAAEACYADAYWFDQAACSSPRAIFWVGDPDAAADAAAEFRALLAGVLERKAHVPDPAMAVQKRVSAYGAAADGAVRALSFTGPGDGIAILELTEPAALPRRWLGAGTFAQTSVRTLTELVPVVTGRDQTVCYFGFAREELTGFAHALAGRGVDRFVPFGSALTFSATWDGYDLFAEFTRLVTVQ
ncbi:acyl-CoA reductase [Saccharomonospora sp. NPDC046836]|uniref:acyl-CoA reductase n=1 Tax=Saccharomonospora sp. NPDC046836 TaxID=3156921 RepID=UPI003411BB35